MKIPKIPKFFQKRPATAGNTRNPGKTRRIPKSHFIFVTLPLGTKKDATEALDRDLQEKSRNTPFEFIITNVVPIITRVDEDGRKE